MIHSIKYKKMYLSNPLCLLPQTCTLKQQSLPSNYNNCRKLMKIHKTYSCAFGLPLKQNFQNPLFFLQELMTFFVSSA